MVMAAVERTLGGKGALADFRQSDYAWRSTRRLLAANQCTKINQTKFRMNQGCQQPRDSMQVVSARTHCEGREVKPLMDCIVFAGSFVC